MKSVSSNLAKLKSNVEWAVLPLSDRTGWTRVRFGDVVENCAETCDPQGAELEQFVTLSRGVCPRFLVIAQSTIDPAAPKGQKEIAQGRAKRRPGYIWPNRTGCVDAAGQLSRRYTGSFGISGCRTGLGKFFFMPILIGFAGPFHSPRSYTTADVSSVNDHGPSGWA